jgi:hypothetical protein
LTDENRKSKIKSKIPLCGGVGRMMVMSISISEKAEKMIKEQKIEDKFLRIDMRGFG